MRYYLDDLWPRKKQVEHGLAQVPYLYGPAHHALLNAIAARGIHASDVMRRAVYYELIENTPWADVK